MPKSTKILAILLGCSLVCVGILVFKLSAKQVPTEFSTNSQNLANSTQNSTQNSQLSVNFAQNQNKNSQKTQANAHQHAHGDTNSTQKSYMQKLNERCVKEQNLSHYRELYARPVSEWAKPNIDASVENEWQELAPLPKPKFPADNEYSLIKAYLGLNLFNEPKLSKSGQIACQSCHNAQLGFGDGTSVSFGHDRQKGRRNSQSIKMAAFYERLFWDGRAASLEEQALMPITDPLEMANTLENAEKSAKKLTKLYPLFALAFGDESMVKSWGEHYPQLLRTDENATREFKWDRVKIDPKTLKKFTPAQISAVKKLITLENIAKAIATYERSPFVVPSYSRFDRFIKGNYDALTNEELWGLDLFRNKGRCMNCHYGAILSDNKFHNIGLSYYGWDFQDLGRYEITGDKADLGAFKTPSLVGVRSSAPYFHTGGFATLYMTMRMGYNTAFPIVSPPNKDGKSGLPSSKNGLGDGKAQGKDSAATKTADSTPPDSMEPVTDPLIQRLNLTHGEMEAIEAFLKTL